MQYRLLGKFAHSYHQSNEENGCWKKYVNPGENFAFYVYPSIPQQKQNAPMPATFLFVTLSKAIKTQGSKYPEIFLDNNRVQGELLKYITKRATLDRSDWPNYCEEKGLRLLIVLGTPDNKGTINYYIVDESAFELVSFDEISFTEHSIVGPLPTNCLDMRRVYGKHPNCILFCVYSHACIQ